MTHDAPAPSPRDPLRPTEAELDACSEEYSEEAQLRAAYALALPRLIRAVIEESNRVTSQQSTWTIDRIVVRQLDQLLAAAARLTEERWV